MERPEAGATTAEAFAFKKEIHALARMARQTMAARLSAKTTKAAANGWLRIIGFPRIWPVGGHPV